MREKTGYSSCASCMWHKISGIHSTELFLLENNFHIHSAMCFTVLSHTSLSFPPYSTNYQQILSTIPQNTNFNIYINPVFPPHPLLPVVYHSIWPTWCFLSSLSLCYNNRNRDSIIPLLKPMDGFWWVQNEIWSIGGGLLGFLSLLLLTVVNLSGL